MAKTDRQRAYDPFYDNTNAQIEDDNGEISGVLSANYPPPKRSRGRVYAIGSDKPIGHTRGKREPGMGKLVMNRTDATAYMQRCKDKYGEDYGDVVLTFTVTYSPPNEEGSELPTQTDRFYAQLDPVEDVGVDRSQAESPLMLTIPLFLVGDVFIAGIKQ